MAEDQSMYPADESGESQDNGGKEESSDDQKPEGQTALLDKSVFPEEPKPGDVCKFRVVKVYEDEVEVEYEKEDAEEKSEGKSPSMDEAMGKMDSMAGDGSEEE